MSDAADGPLAAFEAALNTLRDVGALEHDGRMTFAPSCGGVAEYTWTTSYSGDSKGVACVLTATSKQPGHVVRKRVPVDPAQTPAVAVHMHECLLELGRATLVRGRRPPEATYWPVLAAAAAVGFLGCMATLVGLGTA